MKTRSDENIKLLTHVANRLGDLADDVVFIGGCVVGLRRHIR